MCASRNIHPMKAGTITVIPAKAGIHAAFPHGMAAVGFHGPHCIRPSATSRRDADSAWIPVFTGMTKKGARVAKRATGYRNGEMRM